MLLYSILLLSTFFLFTYQILDVIQFKKKNGGLNVFFLFFPYYSYELFLTS